MCRRELACRQTSLLFYLMHKFAVERSGNQISNCVIKDAWLFFCSQNSHKSSSQSKLMVININLQYELTGTENRLAVDNNILEKLTPRRKEEGEN